MALPSERPRRLLWFDSMVMQTAHRTLAGVPPGPYGPEVEAGTTRIVPGPAGGIAWYDGLYTGRVVPIETARGGIVAAFDGRFGATTSLLSASQDLSLTNGKPQPYLGSEARYFPWVTHSTELQPEGGTSMAEGRYTPDLTQDYIGDFLASQTAFQQEISAERARFEWIAIVVVALPVAFLTPATLVGALLESTVQGAQVAYQVARNGITWSTAWDVALLAGGALMSGLGSVDDAASAVWTSRRRLTRGTLARRVRPPALNESELDFSMGGAAALRGAAGALGDLTGTLRVGTDDVARLAAAGAPTILADFAEAARAAELARAARQVDGDLLRTFLGRPDDLLQTARTAAEDLVRTYQTVPPDLLRAARRQESTKDRTGAERYRRSAREVAMGHPSPQPVFEHAQKPGTRTAEPAAQGARRPELRRLGYDAGKAALKPEPHVAVGRSSQYRPAVDVSDAAPMLEVAAAPEPTETVGDPEDLPPEPTAPGVPQVAPPLVRAPESDAKSEEPERDLEDLPEPLPGPSAGVYDETALECREGDTPDRPLPPRDSTAVRATAKVESESFERWHLAPEAVAGLSVSRDGGLRQRLFGGLVAALSRRSALVKDVSKLEKTKGDKAVKALEKKREELAELDRRIAEQEESSRAELKTWGAGALKQHDAEIDRLNSQLEQSLARVDSSETDLERKREEAKADKLRKALAQEQRQREDVARRLDHAEGELVAKLEVVRHKVTFPDEGQVTLEPVAPGINVDRPRGHVSGSRGFTPEARANGLQQAYGDVKDEVKRQALHDEGARIIQTFDHNEGKADGLNTWDRAVITVGPGIASQGVLQTCMEQLRRDDPAEFNRLFADWGIGVQGNKLTVQTADGRTLVGAEAETHIADDPILAARMAASGRAPSFQKVLTNHTITASVRPAQAWSFPEKDSKGAGRVDWATLSMYVSDDELRQGSIAAIADSYHASGSGGSVEGPATKAYTAYVASHAELKDKKISEWPESSRTELADTIARALCKTIPAKRARAFADVYGSEAFPQAPKAKEPSPANEKPGK